MSPIILYVGLHNGVAVFEEVQGAVVSLGNSEEKGCKSSGSDLTQQFNLKYLP